MSSTQTLLIIFSILLISLITLNFYRTSSEQMTMSVDNEAAIAATGIAQSLIDELQNRAFDEFTVTKQTSSVDSLTLPNALGPEAGESNFTLYDDVDDYNGYSQVNSNTRLGDYSVNINVYYVSTSTPDVQSISRTFLKKVDVAVASQYLSDTLTLSHIITY